ncbi:MAG: hypothetical protein HY901_33680 [Deltaproteobacteria bacterium]|nr:hypothetical protein [Deltaproteobacteria bacterium]
MNPVVMAAESFFEKLAAHDPFITRIMEEPKLFLIGDARDLGEPAEDRAAQEPLDEQAGT